MAARDLLGLTAMYCPNCKGNDFMFSGLQKGYSYSSDMELWTCRQCHSTFSEKSLRLRRTKKRGSSRHQEGETVIRLRRIGIKA